MQTVLVTGAAGGIGKAICEVFWRAGFQVIGVDRYEMDPMPYSILQFDISILGHGNGSATRFYERVEEIAEGRLDVLINNAAVQMVKPIDLITAADWTETLNEGCARGVELT